jgi:hypothetical protein
MYAFIMTIGVALSIAGSYAASVATLVANGATAPDGYLTLTGYIYAPHGAFGWAAVAAVVAMLTGMVLSHIVAARAAKI